MLRVRQGVKLLKLLVDFVFGRYVSRVRRHREFPFRPVTHSDLPHSLLNLGSYGTTGRGSRVGKLLDLVSEFPVRVRQFRAPVPK